MSNIENKFGEIKIAKNSINIPEDTKITNEIFNKTLLEGIFTRITRTHPLDYYWLWTYETWSYNGHQLSKKQIENRYFL